MGRIGYFVLEYQDNYGYITKYHSNLNIAIDTDTDINYIYGTFFEVNHSLNNLFATIYFLYDNDEDDSGLKLLMSFPNTLGNGYYYKIYFCYI